MEWWKAYTRIHRHGRVAQKLTHEKWWIAEILTNDSRLAANTLKHKDPWVSQIWMFQIPVGYPLCNSWKLRTKKHYYTNYYSMKNVWQESWIHIFEGKFTLNQKCDCSLRTRTSTFNRIRICVVSDAKCQTVFITVLQLHGHFTIITMVSPWAMHIDMSRHIRYTTLRKSQRWLSGRPNH